MFDRSAGSVKILKHSVRLFLHVINGSKRTVSLFRAATWFLTLCLIVRDRLSCRSPSERGFILGAILCIRVSASDAHAWGLRQPS